jgi:hypothetical protein
MVGTRFSEVCQGPGGQVVHHVDLTALGQQSVHEVRADETSASRYEDSFACAGHGEVT